MIGTSIEIALAVTDDYEWCAQVMAASEPWMTLGRDLEGCRAAVRRPGTELFVARYRLQPAGFILVAPFGLAGSPYIAAIAVAAEMRGSGIGSELLRFAEARATASGHMFLLVSSFNDRALQLYSRLGYERVGQINDYVVTGQTEIILHKRLK